MKTYKLSDVELKTKKMMYLVTIVLCIFTSVISIGAIFVGYKTGLSIALSVVFICNALINILTKNKLGKNYFELDGNVLTAYLKGKNPTKFDISQVDFIIKEHKKYPMIIISANGKAKAMYNSKDIGVKAFNEMIEDINIVINQ